MNLPKFDLSRWSMPFLTAHYREAQDFAGLELTIYAKIRDVETGEPGEVLSHKLLPYEAARHEDYLARFAKAEIINLLLHELDETLYVDGERLCKNPHPKQNRKEV